ncbi:MAG: acetylglutamate kinase [Candidatus Omnitrophica bacterium]|nr:acetylglutamate kinase [Candidatus Omnitrophota bacterium]
MDISIFQKAEALVEAFPYIQKYRGKTFVIKVGGGILKLPEPRHNILHDIAFLSSVGIKAIVVCGAGPAITEEIEKRGKKVKFIEGLRVTDAEILNIVVDVLGSARDSIAKTLNEQFNVKSVVLRPEDNFLIAEKIHWQKGLEIIDLGFVGQVVEVKTGVIMDALEKGVVVLAPLGISSDGQKYNINGDSVSSSVAQALNAEKLIFMTGVRGVMRNIDNPDTLISVITVSQAANLINEGVVTGGMIPKVRGAISSLKGGVKKVHIISGNMPHSLILEVFTEHGVGTEIVLG